MKIFTVIGARPQFVKAAVVSQSFKERGVHEVIAHTGQHFDTNMSGTFFEELDLPTPNYNLNIHSMSHAAMTGRMMESLEALMLRESPDWLLVYGDTNSTLSGALVASKLHIPIAHIESGLRSYNRDMPEEINRIITDRISTLLFAPTLSAVECLRNEAMTVGVHLVGDVMMDAIYKYQAKAETNSKVLIRHSITSNEFYLATIHRPSNTDNPARLDKILMNLAEMDAPVIFPLHPRTKHRIRSFGVENRLVHPNILVIPPVGYLDMITLEKNCRAVVTDSGGIQKEAYLLKKPCFTLRNETEWKETVDSGWNHLVTPDSLSKTISQFQTPNTWPAFYGDGQTSNKITNILLSQVVG